ncbi:MAG: phage tail sheath subtilisin-like domain-containing protein [Pyrinomonadaceae bacterium MAG19_C2-C3]|nr:phage tail sheath subtilisin-like domain-containing protein [Pyrinomonadaceae bacterium MAG19_C2-C3]
MAISAPGTHVAVNSNGFARPAQAQTATQFFAVGYTPWGAVNRPTTVTGFGDFALKFGGFDANSHLADALYAYFALFGGDRATIVRVVGAGATVQTRAFADKAANGVSFHLDAKYPAAASVVDLTARVEDGTTADTFTLSITSRRLGIRERFTSLKLDAASVAKVTQESKLVAMRLGNTTAVAPDNMPAVVEAALTGGSAPFNNLTAGDFIGTDDGVTRTGLQSFNSEEFGGGQVALPGITSQAAHVALIAHAENYHRLAILDLPLGSDVEDAIAARRLLGSSYACLPFPEFEALDFTGSGLKRFYHASGFIAGACAKVEREQGVHKAPANLLVPGVLNVARAANEQTMITEAALGYLTENQINANRLLPQQGTRIYGARVITPDGRVQMVHEARVLNYLYYNLKRSLQGLPFQTIDGGGRLFREAASVCKSVCRRIYRDGGLFGATEDEAFSVVCDRSNNTPDTLDAQELNVSIEVKISPTAERVNVTLDNRPLTVSFTGAANPAAR